VSEDFEEKWGRRRRRSHLAVCAAVLNALAAEKMSLNRITVHMNLNRRVAKLCLEELTASQLVTAEGTDSMSYFATDEGIDWCRRYRLLVSELRYGPKVRN
jgi:predicted transcriptional regulator